MARWIILFYILSNAFFTWMPWAAWKGVSDFQRTAQSANAQLLKSYYEARSWHGLVKYRVSEIVYTGRIQIALREGPALDSAVSSGIVPILYDPHDPSKVFANINDEFSSRTYINGYFFITAIWMAISSIFCGVIVWALLRPSNQTD